MVLALQKKYAEVIDPRKERLKLQVENPAGFQS